LRFQIVLHDVVETAVSLLQQRQGFQEGLLNVVVTRDFADLHVRHHHHHRFVFCAALVGLLVKLHEGD